MNRLRVQITHCDTIYYLSTRAEHLMSLLRADNLYLVVARQTSLFCLESLVDEETFGVHVCNVRGLVRLVRDNIDNPIQHIESVEYRPACKQYVNTTCKTTVKVASKNLGHGRVFWLTEQA